MTVAFEQQPTLVLNADFRPLSYFPLSLWSWQDTVKAVIADRVSVLSEYDTQVHSPSFAMALPSVIALRDYIKPGKKPAFTRFNVFLRDRLVCQYCGEPYPAHELTFDHVVPRSQGGRTTWQNVVSACSVCNLRKGGRTPRQAAMPLLAEAMEPSAYVLLEHGRSFPPNFLHESWNDYLYWDTELER